MFNEVHPVFLPHLTVLPYLKRAWILFIYISLKASAHRQRRGVVAKITIHTEIAVAANLPLPEFCPLLADRCRHLQWTQTRTLSYAIDIDLLSPTADSNFKLPEAAVGCDSKEYGVSVLPPSTAYRIQKLSVHERRGKRSAVISRLRPSSAARCSPPRHKSVRRP